MFFFITDFFFFVNVMFFPLPSPQPSLVFFDGAGGVKLGGFGIVKRSATHTHTHTQS